jgi:hypothetical protein
MSMEEEEEENDDITINKVNKLNNSAIDVKILKPFFPTPIC